MDSEKASHKCPTPKQQPSIQLRYGLREQQCIQQIAYLMDHRLSKKSIIHFRAPSAARHLHCKDRRKIARKTNSSKKKIANDTPRANARRVPRSQTAQARRVKITV